MVTLDSQKFPHSVDLRAGSLKVAESRGVADLLLRGTKGEGWKRVLLPMVSIGDIPSIPGELFAKFQTGFYSDLQDVVFKALRVE